MPATPDYCSMLSRDAAEPLWGTARYAERWLLIEYTAAWPAKVLKGGVLPDAMLRRIDALQRAFPSFHTLFIRQAYARGGGRLRAFLVDCREGVSSIQRVEFGDYEELAAIDLAGYWDGRAQGAAEAAMYLVCTHGSHDKCCAKFGLPVYQTLAARYGDRVWEASHLGGHRFAANVICFPSGVCYGRVTPDLALGLIETDARGDMALAQYRGRFALEPQVQAAEYFVRTRLALTHIDDLRQNGCTQIDKDHWSVSFRDTRTGLQHDALIERQAEPLLVFKDCEASAAEPVRAFALADGGHQPAQGL